MKYIDTVVIHWDFDHLFPGNRYIWADVNAKESNPDLKKFCVSSLSIHSVDNPIKHFGPDRVVFIDINENLLPTEQRGGLWSMSFAETLEAAGAKEEGFIRHGSMDAFWKLHKGENFSDGAIRIGRMLFKMLNIRGEGPPTPPPQEVLLSLFAVYKVTHVRTGKISHQPFDEYLRQRHGLPALPVFLDIAVVPWKP